MRLRKKEADLPSIVIIPMIDIMFFLLVFFMLSTMNMRSVNSVPVNLAPMKHTEQMQNDGVFLTINEKKEMFLNKELIAPESLVGSIQSVLEKHPDTVVVLCVDKQSAYEDFSDIIDKLKYAGVKKVALAAEAGK